MKLEWDEHTDLFPWQNGVRSLWKDGHSMVGFVSREITHAAYKAEVRPSRVDNWINAGLFSTIEQAKSAVENCKEIYL